ncbi:hypothetical protein JQC92_02575 [Shewanella sp. 202IG2-18]|uniref:hypothetical protein n=1 Tax=Parashewanella hymeniacidonis TaxID=2807618 RepID=UPI00195F6074|nr:hypothetical protein [Parashewanella hymeniacidonis]MBM7070927.1 hypothetical protein [Parashewanella hymeniacidonis]
MSKITQEQWNAMNDLQRYEYLSDGDIFIHKQVGIRADSKVNDDNSCVVSFVAFCNGVRVSNEQPTNTAAMKQATQFIESLKGQAA